MYLNVSMSVPFPDAYVAFRTVSPLAISSKGIPVTTTSSLNATVMLIMAPTSYVPSLEVTDKTVGAVVSGTGTLIVMFFEPPSESGPDAGSERLALLLFSSRMDAPPGSVKASMLAYSRRSVMSPSSTV